MTSMDEQNALPGAEEPLMVNVTRMDRERYFEAVKARGRYGRSVALLAGGGIAALIGLFMGSCVVAALGLLIAVLSVLSPVLIGRRDYRRLCELHPGGEWTKTVRFYSDRVETDSGEGAIHAAPYSAIRRESETEHLYILEFGRVIPATAFDKNGFIKGSADQLRSFLAEARRRVNDAPPEENVDQQGKTL